MKWPKRNNRDCSAPLPWLVLISVLVAVGGCASRSGGALDTPGEAEAFERPGWADQSYFQDRGGRQHHFVGIGYGEAEAVARHEAQQDALAQFATHMGAEVLAGSRIRAQSRTDALGINRGEVTRDDFTGVSSQALIESGSVSYRFDRDRSTAWAKLTLPTESIDKARAKLQADYEAQAEQQAQRQRTLLEQRMKLAEGDSPKVIFAQASAGAVIARDRTGSLLAQHKKVLEQARYDAILKLNSQINGNQIRQLRASDTAVSEQSAMVSTGRVHWEVVGERVWVLGDDLTAQVTLFGWSRVDER